MFAWLQLLDPEKPEISVRFKKITSITGAHRNLSNSSLTNFPHFPFSSEDELLRAEEHGKFWYAIQRCQTWSSVFSDVMAWSQQVEQPAMVED
jgi:hypothetical protein